MPRKYIKNDNGVVIGARHRFPSIKERLKDFGERIDLYLNIWSREQDPATRSYVAGKADFYARKFIEYTKLLDKKKLDK